MSRTGGMHARHLVPQSYFWNGLLEKAGLADNVPSIPLTEAEHLRILHPELDTFSAATGMGKASYNDQDVARALARTAEFYDAKGLDWAAKA